MARPFPRRIVCLSAETAELAFALGCGDRVVGVTGYAVRPPECRKLPRVAAFRTGSIEKIAALRPDLVLAFSDLQADLAAGLARAGLTVLLTNQRTLEETYDAMTLVAAALGASQRGAELVAGMRAELHVIAAAASALPRRPRLYFEEWDDPMIAGIGWVQDLVEIAGAEDIFPEFRHAGAAAGRIVDQAEVVARAPDVIVASWCGKKANLGRIAAREGWQAVPAVASGRVYEIKSADILQPGLSLLHGARQLAATIRAAADGSQAHVPAFEAK